MARHFALALAVVVAVPIAAVSITAHATPTSTNGLGGARNGALTIFSNRLPVASIDTVGEGPPKTVWRCPHDVWCGEEVSMAWAPDGRHLALTLDEIGGLSGYAPGLHVIDVVSGREIRIPSGAPATTGDARFPAYRRKMIARVGCWPATELDWSPDGSSIAYRCGADRYTPARAHINVLRFDGTGFRTIPTKSPAFWPSWSPDSRRIAYSTGLTTRGGSSVFTVAVDGSHRRFVAKGATAPAWSPDGRTIAVETSCGVRLLTPAGEGVRRSGRCGIGRPGRPVWSPDGSRLVIEANPGIYELPADGSGYRLLSCCLRTSTTWYGAEPGRPSWRPRP